MKKVIVILSLSLLMLVLFNGFALAQGQSIRVFVNNNEVAFSDQKPFINADSRTMVPARFISEKLGAKVDWIAAIQSVKVITNKGETIQLQIGVKIATVGVGQVTLDTAPDIVNNRTMVPLRFVSECLGAKVVWDGEKRIIYITSTEYNDDMALVNSDLLLRTPPAGTSSVDLIAIVSYKYSTPVEPQLMDLQELLEKRLGTETATVMEHIRTKVVGAPKMETRDWTINGKHVRVGDGLVYVSIMIWI